MKVLIFFLVITIFGGLCQGKITITKLEIKSDPSYSKIEHTFHSKDDGKTYISAHSEVLQDITDDITVHGTINYIHEGKIEPLTKIFPVNFCQYLDGTKKNAILELTWGELAKHGELPKSCPIKKGTYNVKDFYPNDKIIPMALPKGEYHVEVFADLSRDGKPITQLEHIQAWATVE